MSHDIDQDQPSPPPTIIPLIVQRPSQDIRDSRKHARRGEEDGKVADADRFYSSEDNVADCADEGGDDEDETALLGAVGDEGGDEGAEEGDEVRGCGEALGVDAAVAHLYEDEGHVDGEAGVGDVGAEVEELELQE